ncbi:MAG: hypothetical protein HQL44_09285 [Alphaproteobacteria bacterium]|nr:hypothetical protein [Alphaproteobacteria bacterium]
MTKDAYIFRSAVIAAIDQLPKFLRDPIISDSNHENKLGVIVEVDAVLAFGDSGISFQRSNVLDAVRKCFASESEVLDTTGHSWRVEFETNVERPTISLTQNQTRFSVPHLLLLSPNTETRLNAFCAEVGRVNLPRTSAERWSDLLRARAPSDDELNDIHDDLNNTPVSIASLIQDGMHSGATLISTLVPNSLDYFDRLIGPYGDEQTLEDYVERVAPTHMAELIKWRPFEGYLFSLLLTAHPKLCTLLDSLMHDDAELLRCYTWLLTEGDILSCSSAIEAGVVRSETTHELIGPLKQLVGSMFSALATDKGKPIFEQFSNIIIFVYGQIAASRLLASRPPYWRKLAAIAQAALISRCIKSTGADASNFSQWALSARGHFYLMQGYIDLQVEPRWQPELILPDQLRNELVGRIVYAGLNNDAAIKAAKLNGLVTDDTDGSLRKFVDLALAAQPGPLEGGGVALMELPYEKAENISLGLQEADITAMSLLDLVNFALVFRISDELVSAAAETIAGLDYQLESDGDKNLLVHVLVGLAAIAATYRHHKLADCLFILLRKCRRFFPEQLDVDSSFRVAMVACASRSDLQGWSECVGSCMNDLAFNDISNEDAQRLHAHISTLCALAPELWASCGSSVAALRSVFER